MDHRFIPPRWQEDIVSFILALIIISAIAGLCYLLSELPVDDYLKHGK